VQLGDLTEITRRKTSNSIIWFMITLIIFITIFIVVGLTYEFYQHKTYLGYIGKDGDYYVAFYLDDNAIVDFTNGILKIDNNLFTYDKIDISDDYYLGDNPKRLVKLFGNIDEKHLIINNVIKVELQYNKTTLFKLIKKGVNLWN